VYSFFLFGFALQSPDPFLTYPRAIVGLLLYLIVLEIYQERRSQSARVALTLCSLSLVVPIILVITDTRSSPAVLAGSNIVVCLATALMAQGAVSQYLLLKRSQTTGAVSLPMHLVLYGKDLSGLMFGLQIGADAWSIILMHASNLFMRAPIIYTYVRLANR
jgi:peptidoglycan/LPS O-acetylase OafA/YrhL